MIISCYQCTGKSTLGNKPGYVDLESSSFNINGKKPDDWFVYYVAIAQKLSDDGKIVFVSSHKKVREWMKQNKINFISICPSLSLKQFWINKITKRYNSDPSNKNNMALKRTKEYFDLDILNMMTDEHVILLDSEDYNLEELIKKEK